MNSLKMSNSMIEPEIIIKNKRICSFYKEHPSINIEQANLLLIDFLDTMFNHITNDLGSNVNAQLLSYITENKHEMDTIKTNIAVIGDNLSKMHKDMANNMVMQFMNLKKEYIDDVKQVVNNGTLTVNEKINALLDKNNIHLIDKTTLLLNDVIPKNQDKVNQQLQSNFKDFHRAIVQDTQKLASTFSNEKSFQDFITTFDTKYNTMMQTIQQPLFSFFTASEDRISKNIDILKETSNNTFLAQKPILDELGDFLSKYNVSSNKGKYGEQNLSTILNSIYPSAEVKDTTGTKASGDFIMKRLDKPTILFENKEYKANIDKEEIAKFIRDIDTQSTHGIFISQYSGIAFKQNYQIDVHKGNVLVYIQNCEYSADKIRIAVDIIDSLSTKIQELNIDEDNKISKEMLDDINQEYQDFINQKEALITVLTDFQKRLKAQIDDLKLPVLDKYLETKYAYVKQRNFACDLCNAFYATSKQSLSAHKRGCKKKVTNSFV